MEFTSLGNSITSTDKVYSTCIEDIYAIINNSDIKNKSEIIASFWDLFVADALIGNPDRHLDNVGLLYNKVTDSYSFSPIYDCGSSLHALLSYEKKEELLKNDTEGLLPLENEFIKKSIKVRKEEILDKAYQKISKTI